MMSPVSRIAGGASGLAATNVGTRAAGAAARVVGRPSGTYLDRIVPAVRQRLEERQRQVPLLELERSLPGTQPPSFKDAIVAGGVSLIAEVKRASPSKGHIRSDLDVAALVNSYQRGGARAISVLTEQDFFGGSPADLQAAAQVTDLPLLCKDFILDGYQLVEARVAGASAVLLIAALLDDPALARLTELARELSLDMLLEVHDEAECERALRFEDAVLGINNRDLRTFTVSLQTTVDLAQLVPKDRLLVSESGVQIPGDVCMLMEAGVDGVLVGESLLRSPDVEAAVAGLLGASSEGAGDSSLRTKEEP